MMGDLHERYTAEENAEIVLLHASGLSQQQTAQEFHSCHPNRLWPG